MDLQDQLKQLFPDHKLSETNSRKPSSTVDFWMQNAPLICKYEKRKGKPITIIEGYTGTNSDFKVLTKTIKTQLSVGGSFKNEKIIIQGDYRDRIMSILNDMGFNVKRVGG
jgi:translation initiation factor 1